MQKVKKILEKNSHLRELLLYGFIGGGAVVIDLGLFWILIQLGSDESNLYLYIANVIAIAVAVVYSFSMNSIFTFKTRDHLLKRFVSFSAVSVVGILISTMLLFLATFVGISPTPAKIISLPFIFVTQFTLNRLITFKKSQRTTDDTIIETAIEEGDVI